MKFKEKQRWKDPWVLWSILASILWAILFGILFVLPNFSLQTTLVGVAFMLMPFISVAVLGLRNKKAFANKGLLILTKFSVVINFIFLLAVLGSVLFLMVFQTPSSDDLPLVRKIKIAIFFNVLVVLLLIPVSLIVFQGVYIILNFLIELLFSGTSKIHRYYVEYKEGAMDTALHDWIRYQKLDIQQYISRNEKKAYYFQQDTLNDLQKVREFEYYILYREFQGGLGEEGAARSCVELKREKLLFDYGLKKSALEDLQNILSAVGIAVALPTIVGKLSQTEVFEKAKKNMLGPPDSLAVKVSNILMIIMFIIMVFLLFYIAFSEWRTNRKLRTAYYETLEHCIENYDEVLADSQKMKEKQASHGAMETVQSDLK